LRLSLLLQVQVAPAGLVLQAEAVEPSVSAGEKKKIPAVKDLCFSS
jgi:hypothetical protein